MVFFATHSHSPSGEVTGTFTSLVQESKVSIKKIFSSFHIDLNFPTIILLIFVLAVFIVIVCFFSGKDMY